MIKFIYAPLFLRQFKKLNENLQKEVVEKIELLKDSKNHNLLSVHKLHGRMKDNYSFYVNYKIRIVFMWEDKHEIILLAIGDHDIYK